MTATKQGLPVEISDESSEDLETIKLQESLRGLILKLDKWQLEYVLDLTQRYVIVVPIDEYHR